MLFALFSASVFAYDVLVKVTVSQDTLAVGTNITIVKDGTVLYNTRADGNGAAAFSLDAGSYFVYLDRGGYSRHVNLLEVSKSDNITYTMRQLISYASAYGQVTGPSDFNSTVVSAYSNGNIAKRTTPNKDGYYLMSYIPEGEYVLAFDAQGFVEKNVSATMLQSQFSEVNVKLDKVPVAPDVQPTITVPSFVQKQSVIEILVVKGSLPISGQVVAVKTPAGNFEVITGVDGKAHVNAAAPGDYVFTYGNLTSKTTVEGAPVVPVQKPNATETVPLIPPATEQPQVPISTGGIVAGAALVVAVVVIVALGIIIFVASKLAKEQKPKAHEKEEALPHEEHVGHEMHEHKHAHAHPHKHEHTKKQ